jgi:hypothetical protein
MNYFKILFNDDNRLGVGRSIKDTPLFFSPYKGKIIDWNEPILMLSDGIYPDYLSSDFGGRICSERMKKILDEGATEFDCLQWFNVKVMHDSEVRHYSFLHFPNPPDVLDQKKTIFAEGTDVVVRPVLCAEKIKFYAVFTYANSSLSLIVNEVVAKKIQAQSLTGIQLSEMPVI